LEDETSGRLRSRDALSRERSQIRYYRRGMTRKQRRDFQRRIEEAKREMGLGGSDQLSDQELQLIREAILGTAEDRNGGR
jgi:hypothetical protein